MVDPWPGQGPLAFHHPGLAPQMRAEARWDWHFSAHLREKRSSLRPRASVRDQELIQALAGVIHDGGRLLDLCGRADLGHLPGRQRDLAEQAEEAAIAATAVA